MLKAIILEPAVQFTYHLQIRYTIDGPVPQVRVEVKREKEFLMITPDGKIQQLKVEQKPETCFLTRIELSSQRQFRQMKG
ncbi:hypothetical protein N9933_03760 [bacterium]|nr:hypothetical protein [bacterium]